MSYPVTLSSQAEGDVLRERERQHYEEGFDATHDDQHRRGELVSAAIAYAVNAVTRAQLIADGFAPEKVDELSAQADVPRTWPWERAWWKPKDARHNLVRAAALIIAEIDRLDRAEARRTQT